MKAALEQREAERTYGIGDPDLTPVPWSAPACGIDLGAKTFAPSRTTTAPSPNCTRPSRSRQPCAGCAKRTRRWRERNRVRGVLTYKAGWYGSNVWPADRWFPSSRLCGGCGAVNRDLTLADRVWACGCGLQHDRDVNAARSSLNTVLLEQNAAWFHLVSRPRAVPRRR
ncbi:zinc ribbon domain-containing protein [Nonomuraea maheshkhaliensis]|uniref:zinc ribbon domain-containing protein n=1 Tax=Nonomuraea maheshkhaliensis TaxID=419590 RepID=UPI003D158231